jgi:adenylate kinase
LSKSGEAQYFILLGAPGAGKGTQAVALTQAVGVPHMASGDVFRAVRQEESVLGELVRSYYDRGMLIPDDVTMQLILTVLSRPEFARGAVLDGFPRTLEQAQALDKELNAHGKSIQKVLYITVPDDELIRRISGRWLCKGCSAVYHEHNKPPIVAGVCDACGGQLYQRVDDTTETARTRLETFNRETEPLARYYRDQGRLCEVNGQQSVEAVSRDLQACVVEEGA